MLHRVVALAIPGLAPFEFGVLCEVFGIDRSSSGAPAFDFRVATADPGPVRTSLGFDIVVTDDLSVAAEADLIAVAARSIGPVDERYLDVIRAAEARGAWVLSVCSGSFVLGESGILDGRRSATHWMYADEMQRAYPRTVVDPDVLFVEDRRVITGAGTAAGIDACLHLVRREHGAAAASVIARRMVVPPQRDGGQSQYIQQPEVQHGGTSLAELTDWMLDHLGDDHSVETLARRALMSERTFARRFRAELGESPAAWLNRQRLLRAQQLLEESDAPVEEVARVCGFGSSATLRHHFTRSLGTTPQAYRRAFGVRAAT
ncbi:MAG: helix-turn-helix domain-containing protein [Microcella sp.]|uniref:GlxA family transcriptional regulator n=1 Tax=Microcella sp. TaxID=1913979 RepID=UPI0033156ABD